MNRNLSLDYFKIFLSILVIAIHLSPLFEKGALSGWLISNGIARITSPCFFIIIGYYIYNRIGDGKAVRKQVLHLLLLYAVWTIIYSPLIFYKTSIKSVILGLTMGVFNLWFLPAAIIGILVLFFAKKYIKNDIYLIIAALMLFIGGYYFSMSENIIYLYRNALTIGFPFILLGYYIRKHFKPENIQDSSFIIVIAIGIIAVIMESYFKFIITEARNPHQNLFFSMFILCPALILFIQKYAVFGQGGKFINIVSTGIYFIHPLVIHIVRLPDEYTITKFPLVLLFTVILAYFVYWLNKYIKIFY